MQALQFGLRFKVLLPSQQGSVQPWIDAGSGRINPLRLGVAVELLWIMEKRTLGANGDAERQLVLQWLGIVTNCK